MRIGLFYESMQFGGCETRTISLGAMLRRLGHEVSLLTYNLNRPALEMLCEWAGFPIENVIECAKDALAGKCVDLDVLDIQCSAGAPLGPQPHAARVYTIHGIDYWIPPLSKASWLISVADCPKGSIAKSYPNYLYAPVSVDLDRFRYHKEPGKGVAFFGRFSSHKLALPHDLWSAWNGPIDLYGYSAKQSVGGLEQNLIKTEGRPPQVRIPGPPEAVGWAVNPAEIMPKYRVCLGACQCAIEAMACGRLVMVGMDWIAPSQRFVGQATVPTPENIDEVAKGQFGTFGPTSPREPKVMAETIDRLLAGDYDHLRPFYRQWIEENRDLHRQAEEILTFYQDAVFEQTGRAV